MNKYLIDVYIRLHKKYSILSPTQKRRSFEGFYNTFVRRSLYDKQNKLEESVSNNKNA